MRWFNPGGSNGYRGVFTTKVLSTNSFAFNNPVYDDSKNVTVTSPSGYNLVNALWGRGTFFTIHRSPVSGEANNQEMMISTDGGNSFQFFNTKARYFGNNWTNDFGSDAENASLYQFKIEYTFNLRQEFVDIDITVRQYKKSDQTTIKGTLVKQVRSYDGVNFPLRNTFPLRYWQGVQAGNDYWCLNNTYHPIGPDRQVNQVTSANGKVFNISSLNIFRLDVDHALGTYKEIVPLSRAIPPERLNKYDVASQLRVNILMGSTVDLYNSDTGFIVPGSSKMLARISFGGKVNGSDFGESLYVVVDRNMNFVREFSTDVLYQAINPAYPTGMVNAKFLVSGNPDSDTLIAQPWFQNAANQYNSDGVMSKTFRSTDFGNNWEEITPSNYIPYTGYYPQTYGRFIRYVGKRTWQLDYQGNTGFKFVSRNDGATWSLVDVQGFTNFVLPNDVPYSTVIAT